MKIESTVQITAFPEEVESKLLTWYPPPLNIISIFPINKGIPLQSAIKTLRSNSKGFSTCPSNDPIMQKDPVQNHS